MLDITKLINQQWRNWQLTEKPIVKQQFSSQSQQAVFLLESAGQEWILKQFTLINTLSINEQSLNKTSIDAQALAADSQRAPKLHFVSDSSDYVVMQRLRETAEIDLSELGKALKSLHTLPTACLSEFNTQSHSQNYLNQLDQKQRQLLESRLDLTRIEQGLAQYDCQQKGAFCHNDLVRENVLFTASGAQFIDFDYCQKNSLWFDLASITIYFELNDEETKALLSSYFSGCFDHSIPADASSSLADAQVAVLWLDLLWQLTQSNKIGANDIEKTITQLNTIMSG